jgi:HD-GYP domain-containing protein (c-di-GMP phosphodiesterase class II)
MEGHILCRREAKILAVADVVEAMSSHRPYRPTLGMPAALAEIREHAGVKFDADVAAACVRVVEGRDFRLRRSALQPHGRAAVR